MHILLALGLFLSCTRDTPGKAPPPPDPKARKNPRLRRRPRRSSRAS